MDRKKICRIILVFCGVAFGFNSVRCAAPPKGTTSTPPEIQPREQPDLGQRSILDFEQPNPAIEWVPASANLPAAMNLGGLSHSDAAATQGGGEESKIIGRSSLQANTGLWCFGVRMQPDAAGALVHHFDKAVNLQDFDRVSAAVVHRDAPARSGEWRAAVFLEDVNGHRVTGDPYPVTSKWSQVTLDLKTAQEEGVDLSRVAIMGVAFSVGDRAAAQGPLVIETDTWMVEKERHTYIGERLGLTKTFYAQREGGSLRVGVVDQYEITFYNRAGTERPWLTVSQRGKMVMGEAGTGLALVDETGYDELVRLGNGIRQDMYAPVKVPSADGAPVAATLPPANGSDALFGLLSKEPASGSAEMLGAKKGDVGGNGGLVSNWPGGESAWSWECVWTSPVGAIVEVKQEVGPYDRLGEPSAELKWRFMIYQWGEVFVHVEWTLNGAAGKTDGPISWVLALQKDVIGEPEGMEAKSDAAATRLLEGVYPARVREGLTTALPDEMQRGAPVAMVAKPTVGGAAKDSWWWAEGARFKYFGAGFEGVGHARDCMLLVNGPSAIMQAGSFAQYLAPPKVKVRQGELDRNFPGDSDNDGLVEPYGFQVIRLANGRARFDIYPQERPLFYPAYLFTVPAAEKDAVDLKDSRVLINIDGKQFADPPAFPDGSFLLQMPYVIDRPVGVEAVVVRKTNAER